MGQISVKPWKCCCGGDDNNQPSRSRQQPRQQQPTQYVARRRVPKQRVPKQPKQQRLDPRQQYAMGRLGHQNPQNVDLEWDQTIRGLSQFDQNNRGSALHQGTVINI